MPASHSKVVAGLGLEPGQGGFEACALDLFSLRKWFRGSFLVVEHLCCTAGSGRGWWDCWQLKKARSPTPVMQGGLSVALISGQVS